MESPDLFEPGSKAFFQEAAYCALSDSSLGSVVISNATQGARLDNTLARERDFNDGEYLEVKTVTLGSGNTFATMLVPHGTIQQVLAY